MTPEEQGVVSGPYEPLGTSCEFVPGVTFLDLPEVFLSKNEKNV